MSISISRTVPDFEEVTGQAMHTFSLSGHSVVVTATAGMFNTADEAPTSIVAFEGKLYHSDAHEELLGEHESYYPENILRDNRGIILSKLTSIFGAKKPTSVESFFYEFMSELCAEADISVDSVELSTAFETIASELIESGAFSQMKGEGNWKPYVRVFADKRWLDSVE